MPDRSPAMTSSTNSPISKPRRQSFLDLGGPNSINNFASSYTRAQSFVGSTLADNVLADEISPCTLNAQDEESAIANIDEVLDSPNAGRKGLLNSHRGFENLDTFHFPQDENTPLIHSRKNSRSSIGSSVGFHNNSMAPQTIFNAVNTLMGIAMLSLSYGFRLSGWVVGTILLLVCAWTTSKTAKILGSILKKNKELVTYGDIAYSFGGSKFQVLATCIFMVDLLGAAVLLVLLFSDSFTLIFPDVSAGYFKVLVVAVTFILSFLPLAMISLVSLTGIISTIAILVLITLCGFLTKETPGSLLSPAPTNLWPNSLREVILSLGIFMAPWGGHPVFPELYRDMRHPKKFDYCCNVTFLFTFKFDYIIAIVGYLMFGQNCADTLTKNIMTNKSYPSWVKPFFSIFLGILPISKLALVTRPIVSVYESYFRMNEHSVVTYKNGRKVIPMTTTKFISRLVFLLFLLLVSFVFTSFGKVIAFLGSAICFTICVTLPLMFHLKLNADILTPLLRGLTIAGIALGLSGAIAGTYASFVFEV
ncbi:CIC11C00000000347 [Sungouiella intermedia]|uniref:CIC11C00000000347 n=1 Tax=Sungouiella intermedia TaxID=45354 RepID=A0A1L0BDR2_9ASCO|nr:CIC11C00000000347 [[Candida] intermedia]